MMKKTIGLMVLMSAFLVTFASALTFSDDFDNSNYTSEGWQADSFLACPPIENTYALRSTCETPAGAVQNFSLYGFDFNAPINYTFHTTSAYPSSEFSYEYSGIKLTNDDIAEAGTAEIFLSGDYADGTDRVLAIICSGSCSCSNTALTDSIDGYRYWATTNPDTGEVMLGTLYDPETMAGGMNISVTVTGCDISTLTNIVVMAGHMDYTNFDYFTMTGEEDTCTPNWSCSSFGSCNSSNVEPCLNVTDGNSCGEAFNGTLSTYDGSCTYSRGGHGSFPEEPPALTVLPVESKGVWANLIAWLKNLWMGIPWP